MKPKLLIAIAIFTLNSTSYAITNSPFLKPETFNSNNQLEKVVLSYPVFFDKKEYYDVITLLRTKKWFDSYGIKKAHTFITEKLPYFLNINKHIYIDEIKNIKLKLPNLQKNQSYVIGIFKEYVNNTQTYHLKNKQTGQFITVQATPNHPFYVVNKHKFIPISAITKHDTLINSKHQFFNLLCPPQQLNHCGSNDHNLQPKPVYNLEIYNHHTYYVTLANILVHNCSGQSLHALNDPALDKFKSEHMQGDGVSPFGFAARDNENYVELYKGVKAKTENEEELKQQMTEAIRKYLEPEKNAKRQQLEKQYEDFSKILTPEQYKERVMNPILNGFDASANHMANELVRSMPSYLTARSSLLERLELAPESAIFERGNPNDPFALTDLEPKFKAALFKHYPELEAQYGG